jgi:TPR repeat protein
MYFAGRGFSLDYREAAKWLRLAANADDPQAQVGLSLMYSQGQGVPQDYVRAHMWANLAAANGNTDGAKLRDGAASKMTPNQIAEAQRLASEWKPKPSGDSPDK